MIFYYLLELPRFSHDQEIEAFQRPLLQIHSAVVVRRPRPK